MADAIYKDLPLYVPYMRHDLYSTLKKLVLEQKTYAAIAVEEGGAYIARLLVTVAHSKQLQIDRCGFFSHFECINDAEAAKCLFRETAAYLKEQGAVYLEGTYYEYDRDNRRGILVEGFDSEPMILTSYNPRYYGELLEACGFTKDFDTVSYKLDYAKFDFERISRLRSRILERYGLYVSHADFSKLDREIDDVHRIISAATTEIIFEDAPSKEELVRIVHGWKSFLWEDLILIVRRKEDNAPVGMMMSIPNYYTVFRKMKGKLNPVALIHMFREKKRIRSTRAILQYVIPEYQNKGVNFVLYHEFYRACKNRGIEKMEAGTIMENNVASRRNVESASGQLEKIYRIYGKKL